MRNIILLIAYTLLALPFLLNARSAKGIFGAVKRGQVNLIQAEVNKGASINAYNKDGYTALMLAVKDNKPNVARVLLRAGASAELTMRGSGQTAMHLAAETGNPQIIKILKDHDAHLSRLNSEGKTPADLAREKGHRNIVGLLQ